jgi:Cu/Ag efflux protein CusF
VTIHSSVGEEKMWKTTIIAATALDLSIALSTAQTPLIDGQVMKVDESTGKITIRHGAIKRLDMEEGMTMVFEANDPDTLKPATRSTNLKTSTGSSPS